MVSSFPRAPEPDGKSETGPSTWLVLGDKLGDNAQVEIIARALGWPCQRKRLRFLERYAARKPVFRPSVHHVEQGLSDPLVPPWPDVVITVGRRPSMAALWIREQSRGRTKLVIIGRPRRMLNRFDLVIATPQYRLPDRPNVLNLDLPLMQVDEARIAEATRTWHDRFRSMPRPLTAVLVGGPTQPLVLDAPVARRLIEMIERSPLGGAGTLFVTTSRRTPVAAVRLCPPSRSLHGGPGSVAPCQGARSSPPRMTRRLDCTRSGLRRPSSERPVTSSRC